MADIPCIYDAQLESILNAITFEEEVKSINLRDLDLGKYLLTNIRKHDSSSYSGSSFFTARVRKTGLEAFVKLPFSLQQKMEYICDSWQKQSFVMNYEGMVASPKNPNNQYYKYQLKRVNKVTIVEKN